MTSEGKVPAEAKRVTPEDHPGVRAAVETSRKAVGRDPEVSRWIFSTDGVASVGRLGIPTIGYGPANQAYARSPQDQRPIDHLGTAAAWYAAFPQAYLAEAGHRTT